jgi:hypothetical protein
MPAAAFATEATPQEEASGKHHVLAFPVVVFALNQRPLVVRHFTIIKLVLNFFRHHN